VGTDSSWQLPRSNGRAVLAELRSWESPVVAYIQIDRLLEEVGLRALRSTTANEVYVRIGGYASQASSFRFPRGGGT
jgi:hypothetical protein